MKSILKNTLFCLILSIGLIACQNPNTSDSNNPAPVPPVVPEWTTPTKAELVGTWKANVLLNGLTVTTTISINADYTGSQLMEGSYSEDLKDTATGMLEQLNDAGYTTNHNETEKTFTASKDLSTVEVDAIITETGWQINAAKNQIKYTQEGTTGFLNKQ